MSDEEILEFTAQMVEAQRLREYESKIGHRAFYTEGFWAKKDELKMVLRCELEKVKAIERVKQNVSASQNNWSGTNFMSTVQRSMTPDLLKRNTSVAPVVEIDTESIARRIAMNVLQRYGKGDELGDDDEDLAAL